jgi:endonuclease/exonuclease/phosphatase family metal-dependent hydrolase
MGLLRLATFNLLHGQALPPSSQPSAAADNAPPTTPASNLLATSVGLLEADVLGIQEVDRHQPRSGGVDQTAVVAEAIGAQAWRFVATVHGSPGSRDGWRPADDGDHETAEPTYGIALLSRFPVRDWRVRRFPAAPVRLPLLAPGGGLMGVSDEPRAAIATVVDTPAGAITVVTTHLSFVPGWNVRQLRAISRWVADLPAPRVLLGDVNMPGALPRLVSGWTQLARVPTYPSYHPRVQFDHVLADDIPDGRVRRVEAMPRPVSDHCALLVDIDLDGRQP